MKKPKDSESERFIQVIDNLIENGIIKSYYKLAQELEIPIQRFSDIKSGKQSVQRKLIDDICERYPLNKKYLTSGEGDSLREPETLFKKAVKTKVPFYDVNFTAGPISVFDNGNESPSYYIDINPFNDCELALPIFGDSMYPQFQNGDIVLCKKIDDKSIIPLGEAYLIVTKEHRMLKYLRKGPEKGVLMAASENKECYDPFPIKIDDILKLYKVKGVIKRKTI